MTDPPPDPADPGTAGCRVVIRDPYVSQFGTDAPEGYERTADIPQAATGDLAELAAEVARQDCKYGPFTATVAGALLAVACLEREVREVDDAWREERKADGWPHMREELLQVAAVAMRAFRDLGAGCG